MSTHQMVISCEHGGNLIPEAYQHLFAGQQQIVASHRGWDPGALEIAKFMAEQLGIPLFYDTTTRLLIELNRSLHHPDLFSEFSHSLSEEVKQQVINDHYKPYRNEVENCIAEYIQNDKNVIHLSVHTFTPVFNGTRRIVDIGLLFDPDRAGEVKFCTTWQEKLAAALPGKKICFNEPYLGKDDGFTTYLRTKFPSTKYAGIEIEVNQKYIDQPGWQEMQHAFTQTLSELL